VKKLISIGVVLALVALVVLPVAVGADGNYTEPATFAKIPFGIVASGFYLGQSILNALVTAAVLPSSLNWLPDLMPTLGDWVATPLSWSVDMVAWGVWMVGDLCGALQTALTGMGISMGTMDLSALGGLCTKAANDLRIAFAASGNFS
jgi:hypothetical protein